MKKLNLNQYQYELILNNMPFDLRKQEKTIFEMNNKGNSLQEIADAIKVSKRTVCYREKDLLNKIDFFLNEKELLHETYCVYIHKFPNNKVYVGMTSDIKRRWQNGLGYKENEKMFEDILYYGWNNIEHNIIAENLSYGEAIELENKKIIEYESSNEKKGYNTAVIR